MVTNFDFHPDILMGLTSDQIENRSTFGRIMALRSSWPAHLNLGSRNSDETYHTSTKHTRQRTQTTVFTDSHLQQHQQQQQNSHSTQFIQGGSVDAALNTFPDNYHMLRLGYIALASNQAFREPILSDETPYENARVTIESPALSSCWKDLDNQFSSFTENEELPGPTRQNVNSNSPINMEEISYHNIGNNNEWIPIERYPKTDPYMHGTAIFNPSQTLHLRTNSDSSSSDSTVQTNDSCFARSYENTSYPYSPDSDGYLKHNKDCHSCNKDAHQVFCNHQTYIDIPRPSISAGPIFLKMSSKMKSNSSTSALPLARRRSVPRRSSTKKTYTSSDKKDSEKRIGRRRGPLLPEQRKQASEIRKLRACLRCKFLKKTCDKGDPCAGCQPSHARLWQVPCTRIAIKDIAYFMKDWKADYERSAGSEISANNIRGFAQEERQIWITHGYGFALPIMTREVYLVDDVCLNVSWVENFEDMTIRFDSRTERISVGSKGISSEALSEYLDNHVDGEGAFETFIHNFFEGTLFITDILSTVHQYYVKEKIPVIRKALKLVVAYNLTFHITFVEHYNEEYHLEGLINSEKSKFYNKTVAPVMINFQMKCVLAKIWRGLKSEVLMELSALYSSVYNGDRLKNWPTIFMLVLVLLIIWEEMQFDSHYRISDRNVAHKFCSDMEDIPLGVIVGLFNAISQKLPSFIEWDTLSHGQLLNNNVAVCKAMEDMKSHVIKHENYLRTRHHVQFNPHDFDCLSSKFLCKVVLRDD